MTIGRTAEETGGSYKVVISWSDSYQAHQCVNCSEHVLMGLCAVVIARVLRAYRSWKSISVS